MFITRLAVGFVSLCAIAATAGCAADQGDEGSGSAGSAVRVPGPDELGDSFFRGSFEGKDMTLDLKRDETYELKVMRGSELLLLEGGNWSVLFGGYLRLDMTESRLGAGVVPILRSPQVVRRTCDDQTPGFGLHIGQFNLSTCFLPR